MESEMSVQAMLVAGLCVIVTLGPPRYWLEAVFLTQTQRRREVKRALSRRDNKILITFRRDVDVPVGRSVYRSIWRFG